MTVWERAAWGGGSLASVDPLIVPVNDNMIQQRRILRRVLLCDVSYFRARHHPALHPLSTLPSILFSLTISSPIPNSKWLTPNF